MKLRDALNESKFNNNIILQIAKKYFPQLEFSGNVMFNKYQQYYAIMLKDGSDSVNFALLTKYNKFKYGMDYKDIVIQDKKFNDYVKSQLI